MNTIISEYFDEIKEIEAEIITITKGISFSYPKPTNSRSERKKFFRKFANDEIYNPQLKYEFREKREDVIERLEELRKSISTSNDIYNLKKLIMNKLDENILVLKMYFSWGTIKSSNYCVKVRGIPSKSVYYKAIKYIKRFQRETITFKRLTSKRLGRELQKEVKLLSGNEINVQFVELANKLSILPKSNIIKINPQSGFRSIDLQRLKVHEIRTHYMRYYNAKKLPFSLFEIGTCGYVSTEEGLAVYMEDKHEVLSKAQMFIYSGRVVATYWCTRKSFYEIFSILRDLGFKDEDAYTITLRSKRNLNDTSKKGGYTRDHIYFKGYLEVKKHLEKYPEDFDKLFIGKIGLQDLKILKKFIKDYEKGMFNE